MQSHSGAVEEQAELPVGEVDLWDYDRRLTFFNLTPSL
jgi:hypothetical protein